MLARATASCVFIIATSAGELLALPAPMFLFGSCLANQVIGSNPTIEDQIIAFLAKNYNNPDLTLEDLKSEFGKGKAEISNIIKDTTKLTFPRYLNYLRIEEAKRVLKSGDFKTVAEVGFLVGFNSSSNFIRVFKTQEGVSPKKFLED